MWTRGRHTRPQGFLGDIEKYNSAALLGWRVFRVTPDDLYRMKTINLIKQAILGPNDIFYPNNDCNTNTLSKFAHKVKFMKTEVVKLSQIKTNQANPRQIKDEKFVKLVNSILVLPKMLELRPIVTDDTFVALAGNMRFRALSFIAEMPIDVLKARLADLRDFDKKTAAEQDALIEYWERWQDSPTALIIKASELTDDEQREFIIKDNVGFGE